MPILLPIHRLRAVRFAIAASLLAIGAQLATVHAAGMPPDSAASSPAASAPAR